MNIIQRTAHAVAHRRIERVIQTGHIRLDRPLYERIVHLESQIVQCEIKRGIVWMMFVALSGLLMLILISQ